LSLALLLAALPVLYWEQPPATAAILRQAGIERLRVPPASAAAWKAAGLEAAPLDAAEKSQRAVVPGPGIVGRADAASATRRPWINANGWRYLRSAKGRFFESAPRGMAALAAAEAYAYGADLVLAIDPADVAALGEALSFLRGVKAMELPEVADVGVVDDGSPLAGEVMNLLARRNLLFKPVARGSNGLPLVVELGTPAFPEAEAANPDAFALKVRAQLTDERRTLRLYGSEVVLARLTGDAGRRRLQLVNYSGRNIQGLRVRMRGLWAPGVAQVLPQGRVAVESPLLQDDATEFSLGLLGPYAVVDLTAAR
jgi:hypothetical protein